MKVWGTGIVCWKIRKCHEVSWDTSVNKEIALGVPDLKRFSAYAESEEEIHRARMHFELDVDIGNILSSIMRRNGVIVAITVSERTPPEESIITSWVSLNQPLCEEHFHITKVLDSPCGIQPLSYTDLVVLW